MVEMKKNILNLIRTFRHSKKRRLVDNLSLKARVNVEKCPVCDATEHTYLWRTKITKVTTNLCAKCDCIFNDQTLDQQDLEAIGKHGGSLVSGLKMDERLCEEYYQRQVSRYEHVIDLLRDHQVELKNKRCLDLICEVGGHLKVLERYTKHVFGMDLASDQWRFAAEKGHNIIPSHIIDYEADEKYDFVSAVRYFNHFNEPLKIFESVAELLKINGYIYLETFEINAALKRKTLEESLKIDHPVAFSEELLKRILRALGFEIVFSDVDGRGGREFGSKNHSHILARKIRSQRIDRAALYSDKAQALEHLVQSLALQQVEKGDVQFR